MCVFQRRLRFAVALLTITLDAGALAEEPTVTPGKFIPTFAIKYGNTTGWPPAEEAARFDLLDVSSGTIHAKVHASAKGNTWQTLKSINPHIAVFVYQNGPGLYDTSAWGQLGKGWEWLVRNHGVNNPDRWPAVGATHHGYLQGKPYPNERLMNLGSSNWYRYWAEETYAKLWSEKPAPCEGTDGIFADNCGYQMPWRGQWHLEGHPDKKDVPAEYSRDGVHRPDLYKTRIKEFYGWVVPWLGERDRRLVLNFGGMARHPEGWLELDQEPHPVFAAMEEGAFVHPWGTLGRQGNFVFRPERDWLIQVHTMRKLERVRVLMNVHGPVVSDVNDIHRMDASDASGNRAWDVLWYAMTSFLQGYDDLRRNAYMNFTVWGYSRFYWFDEFDPKHLHLGKAIGDMQQTEGATGHVYMREFEDGWVAANPTRTQAIKVPVPRGRARVIHHDNLRRSEQTPLVESFDLPPHRGVVLLKPDRHIGNEDNL